MYSYCCICLKVKENKDLSICIDCFCQIQTYRWLGCTRCGLINCSGCNELESFQYIDSLYEFRDNIATLVNHAKYTNSIIAQEIFFDLFFSVTKINLEKTIYKIKPDVIILAPLHKKRITLGSWHTTSIFLAAIKYLQSTIPVIKDIQIIESSYTKTLKNKSRTSLMDRKISNINFISLSNDIDKRLEQSDISILLLDDVITTGSTFIDLSVYLSEVFYKIKQISLFTLFRTPRNLS